MSRKKQSIIWKISSIELQSVVDRCETYKEVLQHFGFDYTNHRTLQRRLAIGDVNAVRLRAPGFKNKAHGKNKRHLKDVLTENSDCSRTWLRGRLIKEGVLEFKCFECGLIEWRGQKLCLELDHINGISNDNRLENLRLLCPNCHSCTETFSGRNNTTRKKRFNCTNCGIKKKTKRPFCSKCAAKFRKLKGD